MIAAEILDVEEGLWPPSRVAHRDCPSCHCGREFGHDPIIPDPVWTAHDPAGHTWITNRFVILRDDVVELPVHYRTIKLPPVSARAAAAIASAAPAWNHEPTTAVFQSFGLDLLDAAGARVLPHDDFDSSKPLEQRPHAIVLDGRKVGAIMPIDRDGVLTGQPARSFRRVTS